MWLDRQQNRQVVQPAAQLSMFLPCGEGCDALLTVTLSSAADVQKVLGLDQTDHHRGALQ